MQAFLRDEKSDLVQYAKKNNLALLTWNTAILWKSRKSFDELNPREENQLDKVFDQVASSWESGAVQLCKDQGLPIGGGIWMVSRREPTGVNGLPFESHLSFWRSISTWPIAMTGWVRSRWDLYGWSVRVISMWDGKVRRPFIGVVKRKGSR